MTQSLSNNRYLEFANKFYEGLPTMEINLSYIGNVTQEVTCNFTSMTEDNLMRHGEKNTVQRKVFYIMVESLQNISRHADRVTDNPEEIRKGIIVISHNEEAYNIVTGNLIRVDKCEKLASRLDAINAMDPDQLKAAYKKQIQEGSIGESGGAGLGYIDMAKKSGNKLSYEFYEIDELPDFRFFVVNVTVTR